MIKYLWLRRALSLFIWLFIPYFLLLGWLDHKYQCKKKNEKKDFGLKYELEDYYSDWTETYWKK